MADPKRTVTCQANQVFSFFGKYNMNSEALQCADELTRSTGRIHNVKNISENVIDTGGVGWVSRTDRVVEAGVPYKPAELTTESNAKFCIKDKRVGLVCMGVNSRPVGALWRFFEGQLQAEIERRIAGIDAEYERVVRESRSAFPKP